MANQQNQSDPLSILVSSLPDSKIGKIEGGLRAMVSDALSKNTGDALYSALDRCMDFATNDDDVETIARIFATTQKKNSRLSMSDAMRPISKAYAQMGLRKANNPFILFFETYGSTNRGASIPNNAFTILFNLYADGVLTKSDIENPSGDAAIIYDRDLYKMPSSDMEFMVKAYKWINTKKGMQDIDSSAAREILGLKGNPKPIDIRSAIFYKNKNGKLRSRDDVERILTALRNTIDFRDGYDVFQGRLASVGDVIQGLNRSELEKLAATINDMLNRGM